MAGQRAGIWRRMVQERSEQVLAGHRNGQPFHHHIRYPDWGARGYRHGQAQAQAGRDLPGSGRAAQPDPCHCNLRVQLIDVRCGHVDVHTGHAGVGGM
jgi:hypothetical protein